MREHPLEDNCIDAIRDELDKSLDEISKHYGITEDARDELEIAFAGSLLALCRLFHARITTAVQGRQGA